MKFTHGMWLTRPEYKLESPRAILEVRREARSLVVFASCGPSSRNRGGELGHAMLRIVFDAPAPEVIRVRVENHRGGRGREAQFALAVRDDAGVLGETPTHHILRSGLTEVRISKEGWRVDFLYNGALLTSSTPDSMAHVVSQDGKTYMRERLELGVGEVIYGLGERFSALVKNGQSVEIWNEDGGTASEQTYKNIPFALSNRGYGVFVNHTGKVSFEVGSECVSKTQFSVAGERLEYCVIGGGAPAAVLCAYTGLTGRPPLPPDWSFGLWLTTSFTTDYSEKSVMGFIDGMCERGVPLSVFHFDCYWMRECEWTSFTWDERFFPDPGGLIRRIHAKGVRVCVWINPYIGQKSPLFEEGLRHNYLVNSGTGDVWQWDHWQPGLALVDFTNPAAKAWYQGYLERLVDLGVDAFKTDFGERIPVADPAYGNRAVREGIAYADGSSAESMHNYYSFLYNQAVFELLERKRGRGEACLFARSATVGGQMFPVHWGGDSLSSYPSMAESLRGGLSLGLAGFGFWSHDIGGFESGCTPDLYKRWTAFGLLSSHSRYHGSREYKVPWNYGEEAVAVTRHFTRMKLSLMPYLMNAAVESTECGLPVMRAMMLEFPHDPGCAYLDRQYMLGSSLLCAPVFSEDGRVSYYVPAGVWTRLKEGTTVTGPGWREEAHDYFSLPLLVRPNSLLVTQPEAATPGYDYGDAVLLSVYGLEDGHSARARICSREGRVMAEAEATRNGRHVSVRTQGFSGACRIRFPGEATWVGPDGLPLEASGALLQPGTMIFMKGGAT